VAKIISDKERAELAMRLGDRLWRDFDKRRSFEWKLNFALWPALAAFAGLVLRGDVQLKLAAVVGIALALVAIFLLFALVWTPGLRHRNWRDQSGAHAYWKQSATAAGLEAPPVHERRQLEAPLWKAWSHVTQMGVTLLLIIVAIFAMFAKLS
jgi:hypothetical protein